MSLARRLLSPLAEVRDGESATALLMFLSSFCAMAGYNVIKPITRSAFIRDLGADNLPWMPLATAFLIAFLMGGYAWLIQRLPRRWGLPITQSGMAALLVAFWALFQAQGWWVAAAFYVWGLLMGILLTSQFWTLANVIYDARQAKRLFGFVGAGAPLGGAAGAWLGTQAEQIGTYNLLLYSAGIMLASAMAISAVLARERHVEGLAEGTVQAEKGVGAGEAMRLLRSSRHLQVIALVIMFAAIGAQLIEQQLNMAAQDAKGRGDVDAITAFLAQVGMWMSLAAFVIQAFLTSRIHRLLGIGFALFILPIGLGSTAVVMLMNAALWAPGLARVLDQSLRYTVDKTTREILFLPLPTDLKLQAKPFVDVTVDRFGKGVSALLLLILVQDWGFGLSWQQISWASLTMTALWLVAAVAAKRGYLSAFRRSIERRELDTASSPAVTADLSTIETLVEELAHPDEQRVLYAIGVLESLQKRNLITPLLLRHDSPAVRARALGALARSRPIAGMRWRGSIERLLGDPDPEVRTAAVGALAMVCGQRSADIVGPMLADSNPRLVVTAATVMADSTDPAEVDAAEAAMTTVAGDLRPEAAPIRREVASALRHINNPRFRPLLVPLLYDADPSVSAQAMRSVAAVGSADFIYVPTLIALLRNRQLKAAARDVLVAYGPDVLDPLAHFMRDPDEDIWVRRHLPATIARIGTQKGADILIAALDDPDGFLRYKAIEALERLRQTDPALQFPREPIERFVLAETRRYFSALTTHHNLFVRQKVGMPAEPSRDRVPILASALEDRQFRSLDRIYRLLGLLYPWKDIQAARWALERGDPRAKSSASEYLDNVLTGAVRKQVLPALEALPQDERVRRGYVQLRSRPRSTEETLLELINDENQVIAACAIDLVREAGEWSLKDDIEFVLAHRDVRDWYVFEAASWTLATHRVGEARRRELWLEPLPATELVARLRRLPLASSIWIDELFRLASTGRQSRSEAGTVLMQEGSPPDAVHVLLDGTVVARKKGAPGGPIAPPAALGLRETLAGRPSPSTVRAEGAVITLAVAPDDVRLLIADNQDLIDGLLRTLAETDMERRERPSVLHTRAAPDLLARASDGLSPVEAVLLLQGLPLFAAVSSGEMLAVGAMARPLAFAAGETISTEGQAPAIYFVVSGELAVELAPADPRDPGVSQVAGPGDAVGIFETLAGRAIGRTVHATRGGLALKIDRADLIDQLGQRPAFVQQVFASVFDLMAQKTVQAV